jgi:hypothetical protein
MSIVLILLLLCCMGLVATRGAEVRARAPALDSDTDPDSDSAIAKKKKLIAVVHPGPGKTGTSHFQGFLVNAEETLLSHNVSIWPDLHPSYLKCKAEGLLMNKKAEMFKGKVKQLAHYYKFYRICPAMQVAMRDSIRQSAKQGRHVVLSSEGLLINHAAAINILDMLVSEGYQLYGLVTYRFYLNWFISRYGEEIKRSSITSTENKSIKQIEASLLSDYLKKCWKDFLNPHIIDEFYGIIAKYPGFQFRVVDLYGIGAANYNFERLAVCDLLGIECSLLLSEFEKMKSISAHESESEDAIHARQTVFIFYKYAQRENCTMSLSYGDGSERESGRSFLKSMMKSIMNSPTCSLRPVDINSYARRSLELDHNLRTRYSDSFVFGNASVNARKVSPLPIIMEVDEYAAMRTGPCLTAMRQYLATARSKGLCLQKFDRF